MYRIHRKQHQLNHQLNQMEQYFIVEQEVYLLCNNPQEINTEVYDSTNGDNVNVLCGDLINRNHNKHYHPHRNDNNSQNKQLSDSQIQDAAVMIIKVLIFHSYSSFPHISSQRFSDRRTPHKSR